MSSSIFQILQREVDAVRVWEKSGKIMHIMRDHPHHTVLILGGMYGLEQKDNNTREFLAGVRDEIWRTSQKVNDQQKLEVVIFLIN